MDRDIDQLVGKWIHVHEEDDARHRVFRREGARLPPSRSRTIYVISPDLTARREGPGADDRTTSQPGYFVSIGDRQPAHASGIELKVANVSSDRLLIFKD